MMNKIMSPTELVTLNDNLNMIQSSLGHSIPSGLVDMEELSKKHLSPRELDTVVTNMKMVSASRNPNYRLEITLYDVFIWIVGGGILVGMALVALGII